MIMATTILENRQYLLRVIIHIFYPVLYTNKYFNTIPVLGIYFRNRNASICIPKDAFRNIQNSAVPIGQD